MASKTSRGTVTPAVERVLPFPALVGQETLKRALCMLAVNPRLSGLLIRGERGTAKSTAVRALAQLLGEVPFETLPLGVTEDQLLGTMDLERALRDGIQAFAPGLLARVHGGLLYVDEVNLLDDHIVDLLLDVAASGVNVVAREGVREVHAAEFVLVGTMNPEEGELRPQLLDRFGLCVEVHGLEDAGARAEVVSRILAFEADPEGFVAGWAEAEAELTRAIARARALLPSIEPGRRWCLAAAEVALALGADGHRADLLMVKGAATLAALDGRDAIEADDLEAAATVALPHRLRRRPFDEQPVTEDDIREQVREAVRGDTKKKKPVAEREQPMSGGDAAMGHDRGRSAGPIERGGSPVRGRVTDDVPSGLLHDGLWGGGRPADDEGWIQASGAGGEPPGPPARGVVSIRGRDPQLRSIPSARPYRGRSVRSVPAAGTLRDLAWRDTLVGALSRGRRPAGGDAPLLIPADLRRKRRVHRPGRLVLLAVDLSGSMGGELTALARQVSEAVLRRAYVDRERVAMIAFRATTAELLFDATDQVQRVVRELDGLPLGGTTPLARGLELADRVLDRALGREPALRSTLLLVTDGRANVGSRAGYGSVQAEVQALARALARRERLRTLFLDTTGRGKHDLAARRLARELGARRVRLARVRGLGGDPGVRIEQLLMEEWRA